MNAATRDYAVMTGTPCDICGADLNASRVLDRLRRQGTVFLFLECACGERHGVKYTPPPRTRSRDDTGTVEAE